MDSLREAAETIRSCVDPESRLCLVPDAFPLTQRFTQITLLEVARAQLQELDRLLARPPSPATGYRLPADFSGAVDAALVAGPRLHEWRELAAIMSAADHLLQLGYEPATGRDGPPAGTAIHARVPRA